MSAGNLLGSIFNSVGAFVVWSIFGLGIDKIGRVFNYTLKILPSFQDAATGFNMTQTVWLVSLVVIWIVIWVNYALNESSEAGGLV